VAKQIVGEADFIEIYINAPLETCEARDVKGLYAKARRGEIPDFTGIGSPYEAPERTDLEVRTDQLSIAEAVHKIIDNLEQRLVIAHRGQ
jgi:adenylylsulfate kinase-like enzyme